VAGKAVEYLVKSGKKAMLQFSVEESHRYYQDALNTMLQIPLGSKADDETIIDIIKRMGDGFLPPLRRERFCRAPIGVQEPC
jgi:hypothetical protein